MRAENRVMAASAFHGTGGPLRVEDPRFMHPLSRACVASAIAAGLGANDDFNAAAQDGVGMYQLNQRQGRRWSAADACLRPALRRSNLTVPTGTLVTKVLVEGARAAGVRYLRDGAEQTAAARGEVLLCGGAVNTPTLVLLSGIGPVGHLREHGIDVLVDARRVGAGLQDHPICLPEWHTPGTRTLPEELTPEAMALWQPEGRGPMASSGTEAGGFARSRPDLAAPDLQYGLLPGPAPAGAMVIVKVAGKLGNQGRYQCRRTAVARNTGAGRRVTSLYHSGSRTCGKGTKSGRRAWCPPRT